MLRFWHKAEKSFLCIGVTAHISVGRARLAKVQGYRAHRLAGRGRNENRWSLSLWPYRINAGGRGRSRNHSGSAIVPTARLYRVGICTVVSSRRGSFKLRSGEPKIYVKTAESGTKMATGVLSKLWNANLFYYGRGRAKGSHNSCRHPPSAQRIRCPNCSTGFARPNIGPTISAPYRRLKSNVNSTGVKRTSRRLMQPKADVLDAAHIDGIYCEKSEIVDLSVTRP